MRRPPFAPRSTVAHFTALLVTAVLLAGCTLTGSRESPSADAIRAIERARLVAMVAADIPTLERLLAADLQYGHSTGALHSRQDLLALLGSGGLDYLVLDPHELDVRAQVGTALVSGTLDVDATAGSRRLQTTLRFLAVYADREGRWQLIAYQSAAIAR